MSIAMSIFSLLGTFIIGFSMLPQTILTMRTRDTSKLSLALYLVMGIATLLITLYGIGLVIIPNPATHSNVAISAGSFKYSVEVVNNGAASLTGQQYYTSEQIKQALLDPNSHSEVYNAIINSDSYKHACEQNWISGYIVPGAAIIFGELLCSVTSFMIAAVKVMNIIAAKKANMTEAEYVQQHFGDIIKAEQQKQENKAPFMQRVKAMFRRGEH